MTFIPVPSAAMAILTYDVSNLTTINNTLWFTKTGFTTADMEDLLDYITAWSDDHILPNLCTAVALEHVTVYDMRTETGPKVEVSPVAATGSIGTDIGAINAACVITFYTGNRGRSYRGRNYVTGFPEADMGALGFTSTTHTAAVAGAYELLLTEPATWGFEWVVASRYTNGAPRQNGVTTAITSVAVRNAYFGSQRRRINRD